MPNQVLVFRLGPNEPGQVTPPMYGGVAFEDGWRSMLSVTQIWAKLQTTVFFGDSLYMIWYNIGQLSPQDGFKAFLKQHFNRPIMAAQMNRPPVAAAPRLYTLVGISVPPPPTPISQGVVTILDCGFDPLRGYWIEFAGNYFLGFPIFPNFPGVFRDGPKSYGFQPSANNPGSGGLGGGGTGTGGSTPPFSLPPCTC